MNRVRRGFRTSLAVAVMALAAMVVSTATSPAANSKKVFWIDMYYQAEQKPDFVYFTANSGGQVRNVKWKNWGERKAIGRGRFVDTSAGYPGKVNQNGPARLVAWKPIKCTPTSGDSKGKTLRVYRHVRLIHPNGKGGKHRDNVSHTAGYVTCKETR